MQLVELCIQHGTKCPLMPTVVVLVDRFSFVHCICNFTLMDLVFIPKILNNF